MYSKYLNAAKETVKVILSLKRRENKKLVQQLGVQYNILVEYSFSITLNNFFESMKLSVLNKILPPFLFIISQFV